MVWVHWALSELLAAAARAREPEWTGPATTLSSGEQVHGDREPDSKPGFATRLPGTGVGVGVGGGGGVGVRVGVGVGCVGVGVAVGGGPEPCRPFTTAVSSVVDGSSASSENTNAPANPWLWMYWSLIPMVCGVSSV